jgi:hypothetical protein
MYRKFYYLHRQGFLLIYFLYRMHLVVETCVLKEFKKKAKVINYMSKHDGSVFT